MKYVCDVCGWEYDEAEGYPEGGIAPGTKWEDVQKKTSSQNVRLYGKGQYRSRIKQLYYNKKSQMITEHMEKSICSVFSIIIIELHCKKVLYSHL